MEEGGADHQRGPARFGQWLLGAGEKGMGDGRGGERGAGDTGEGRSAASSEAGVGDGRGELVVFGAVMGKLVDDFVDG